MLRPENPRRSNGRRPRDDRLQSATVVRMRAIILALFSCLPLAAQYRLYTCMITSRGYVVGAPLPPSGIFQKPAGGAWEHIGYPHPFISALDYDPRDPSTLYLAAGNGLIRAA